VEKEKEVALIKRVRLIQEVEEACEVARLLKVGPNELESFS